MSNFLQKQVSRNVRCYRASAEISQEELGNRSSLHRNVVGEVERGARLPELDTVMKLAAGLGIAPADLLEGVVWREGSFVPS